MSQGLNNVRQVCDRKCCFSTIMVTLNINYFMEYLFFFKKQYTLLLLLFRS
jgi:hypothetical protein